LPGYLEIDFVSHGGSSLQGVFLGSLVATDVCSGWTEAVALIAREQFLVVEGLEVIRRQFPVPIKGIDSDNDSAFINETLQAYCQQQQWEFTRSRACQKNDQAWIEQKNGAVVRRFVGYQRHSGVAAGQCLARLFQAVRLFVNYFQPSRKLPAKTRVGAKVKKTYHKPATPCDRLLGHAAVAEAVKERLRSEQSRLDPLELLHRIRDSQAALAALSSGELGSGQERESLEQFLAALPELWRQGAARPTHRESVPPPRTWRTRTDPFEKVWPEILLWLQEEPDATAKSLWERLDKQYPGAFPEGQPQEVRAKDFKDKRLGKGIPYGVYDLSCDKGWVSVGIDHDTAAFATESIHRWWEEMGQATYRGATELLITADGGGSNGSRSRLWKVCLQRLADALDLRVGVCHFPPGTSKWNKIEHRMFCHITRNWHGRPLTSRAVIVSLIGNTRTDTGLEIQAALDEREYPTGIKVTDKELSEVRIRRNEFHGEWNYTILPNE